jgi:hypothetical protein
MISRAWRTRLAVLACAVTLSQAGAAAAQADPAKRIRDELSLVQQEQQAVFQQFQMVRELRNELLAPPPQRPALSYGGVDGTVPNYDDQVAAQKDREQRIGDYSRQMEQLYARYQELDGRRQALVEELAQAGGSR